MKKTVFFLFTFALYFGSAQNINLYYDGVLLNQNNSLTDVYSFGKNTFYFDIENTTSETIQLLINRTIITAVPNMDLDFCIGESCIDVNEAGMTIPYEIPAGMKLSYAEHGIQAFHINYDPKESVGITSVRFNFYDELYPELITALYVQFETNTNETIVTFNVEENIGISESEISVYDFYAYPNPAKSEVAIQYKFDALSTPAASIAIRNLLGITVLKVPVNSSCGKIAIPLNDFSSGIYFYSLEVSGRALTTKKLVIK